PSRATSTTPAFVRCFARRSSAFARPLPPATRLPRTKCSARPPVSSTASPTRTSSTRTRPLATRAAWQPPSRRLPKFVRWSEGENTRGHGPRKQDGALRRPIFLHCRHRIWPTTPYSPKHRQATTQDYRTRIGMNPSTLIGIVAGSLLLAIVLFFSAEDPFLFIDLPGLGIVLVGTAAATFIAYPLREVVRVFKLI